MEAKNIFERGGREQGVMKLLGKWGREGGRVWGVEEREEGRKNGGREEGKDRCKACV